MQDKNYIQENQIGKCICALFHDKKRGLKYKYKINIPLDNKLKLEFENYTICEINKTFDRKSFYDNKNAQNQNLGRLAFVIENISDLLEIHLEQSQMNKVNILLFQAEMYHNDKNFCKCENKKL